MSGRALIVGIDDYPSAPLSTCVNDAEALAGILSTHEDKSPNFAVKALLSKNETIDRKKLLQNITNLFSGETDVALFYFSGHGCITPLGGFIVSADAEEYSEGVSMDDILKLANGSKAKERIVILDCCYSGKLGTPEILDNDSSFIKEGTTILTASRKAEAAVTGREYSLFTSLLIDALNGGAADLGGKVSPSGIYAYIDKALGEWEQRPMFKTNVSRFTSLRNVKPPVPLEKLRKIAEYFPESDSEFSLDPSYEFTNDPNADTPKMVEPYANEENVSIMKDLQKFAGVGLVRPVGEEHMYFAAMNSKACKLTPLGVHYWELAKKGEKI